ncbi:NAD(P)H-binding protein [Streptomyces marincola]|uniref:NAD(P)-dependent oxidoreductase n=1 Tax=Streptomyces marincola TaxID=2878388 RepID=A0A1W7D511_9ACTN|nr:NAD(P)H-binding protein [Streptomyces marincola]ARQ72171.1 NAD(P)-dependent oxidoreductase [Streptomyces marincola]
MTSTSSPQPILVVGGTGTVGRRVVSQLRAKGHAVRVASRSAGRHEDGHPFDWRDRETWDSALAGVRSVFVVPLDGTTLTSPFVERAVELGVERIVLLSARGIDVPGYADESGGAGYAGTTHRDGEETLRRSGAAWTIVRPGWFNQNFSETFFRDAVLAGELRLPCGDGAATFVDGEDIAAVSVAALTEDGHAGQVYEVSGPRALTFTEVAAEISAAAGREVRYVPLTHEEFAAELVADGWDETDAQTWAEALSPLRRGLDEHVSDGVRRALGREPMDFADFARQAAALGAFTPEPAEARG